MSQVLNIPIFLNVSVILKCCIFTRHIDKILNIARFLNMSEFWICSGNNFNITSKFQYPGETLKNVGSVYNLKREFFFQLQAIFIPCEFLETVWEMVRHPRHCLAHHLGISSDIINGTHFSTPSMTPTLVHQPLHLRWRTTHVIHAGTKLTWARHPC